MENNYPGHKERKKLQNTSAREPSQKDRERRQNKQHHYKQNIITQYDPIERYRTEPPTLQELKQISKKLKRRKAPGPDNIPLDTLKELDDENLEIVQKS